MEYTNISFLFRNATDDGPHWSVYPITKVILTIAGLLLNAFCAFLILSSSHLRTTFSVYIIAVISSNLLSVILYYPLSIIQDLYSVWRLGNLVCGVLMYGSLVTRSLCLHFHGIITFNRYWAILFPISYRVYHSTKTAVALCVTVAVYVHITEVLVIVLDFKYHRFTVEQSNCYIDVLAQKLLIGITYAISYGVALLIIIVYPYVLWKHLDKRLNTIVGTGAATEKGGVNGKKGRLSSSMTAVTLLTGSVLVCWLPHAIMMALLYVSEADSKKATWDVVWLLNMLQPVFDPLIFLLSMEALQTAAAARWKIMVHGILPE